ncbi:plasma-membrane choline transporter-domain-containing protein [Polychytrium aggregatum]|uniref:plasma-membrane choline transporter-domain-containing protein n=1 Tax=Polychytrium aggregatum TaxID=110093 RepID=UPI0022FDD16A|nr:plasma-membrane choline transporter-domain-containing protein [Polychytrium aggregatum]KAI9204339.1 plasma-membrane choline transporter-domain-containing protein [Polychytrium aggregatum]
MGKKVSPLEKPEYGDEVGPIGNRRCTDIPFLVLFLVFWAAMFYVAFIAIKTGNPSKLLYPTDYLGNTCGTNNTAVNSSLLDMSLKPYSYFLNPIDLTTSAQICISSCPTTMVVYASSTPTTGTTYCKYTVTSATLSSAILSGDCAPFVYASEAVLNRCVPTQPIPASALSSLGSLSVTTGNTTVSINSLLSDGQTFLTQAVSDLQVAYLWLIGGAVAALIIAFIWLLLLRWFAGVFTWLIIIATNVVFIGGAIWLYFFWTQTRDSYNSLSTQYQTDILKYEVYGTMAAFIVVAVLAVILLLVTLVLIKRIRIAIEVIKETSHAVATMPFILLYPFVMWLCSLILLAYGIIIMLYLASPSGAVSITGLGFTLSSSNMTTYLEWFHLFGFLWGWYFISGFQTLTIAGAFAAYYWTLDKSHTPPRKLLGSIYRAFRYHLGSIALGSMLIALVQILRILFAYLGKQAKATQNKVLQYIFACIGCCLALVKRILQFISKNAYIHIAVRGTSFCSACSSACGLIIRNALRVVAVTFVSEFIMLLSTVVITGLTGFISYILLGWKGSYLNLQIPLVPVIFIAIEAFIISLVFMSVYSAGINAIFMCFLEDSERNDGSPTRPYYMSEALQRITSSQNTEEKPKKATGRKARKIHDSREMVEEEY